MNFGWTHLAYTLLCLYVDHSIGQTSPCPDVFQYQHDGNEWYGLIKPQSFRVVPNILMKVELSLEAQLPSNYVGSLKPSESLEITVQRINANEPFSYTLRFPIQSTLPKVTRISINGEAICLGSQSGFYDTKMTLSHTINYSGFTNEKYSIHKQIELKRYGTIAQKPHQSYNALRTDDVGQRIVAETSPCSDIFQYVFNGYEWIGVIVPKSFMKGPTITLEVTLSIQVVSPSKHNVTLGPYESLADTVEKIRYNQPFWYKLTFPMQDPLPKVAKITINEQIMCSEPASTETLSFIKIRYSIYSELPVGQYSNSPDSVILRSEPVTATMRPTIPVTTRPQTIRLTTTTARPITTRLRIWTTVQPTRTTGKQAWTTSQTTTRATTTRATTTRPATTRPTTTRPTTTRPTTTRLTTTTTIPTTTTTTPTSTFTIPTTTTQPTKAATNTTTQVISTTSTQVLTTTQSTQSKFVNNVTNCSLTSSKCGIVDVDMFDMRIINGEEAIRGQYPFLAALFEVKDNTKQFFCGGTLISPNHVLTAAHCIQQKGEEPMKSADDISLELGRYSLEMEEKGVIRSNVKEIIVNEEWNVLTMRLDADLAILVLSITVAFSKYIRPVCLPNKDESIHSMEGSIAGWGLTDNKNTQATIMKHANIRVETHCYIKDYRLGQIISERTFCGKGSGTPNSGDSGGGFFVRSNQKWIQYGIISAIQANGNETVGDDAFSIYTSVKDFTYWIDRVVNNGGDRLSTNVALAAHSNVATQHVSTTENTLHHHSPSSGISAKKCLEYQQFAYKKIYIATLINSSLVINSSNCALRSQSLIINGTETAISEFPHMALIGFRNKSSGGIEWQCGGSLISDQFVLTAAHCYNNRRNEPAKYVRLGEHDLDRTDETTSIDFGVTDRIRHPEFRYPYNDIMLLKLDRRVKFNSAIRPICLPEQFTVPENEGIASGWGITTWNGNAGSNVLQKVTLNFFSQQECSDAYARNNLLKNYRIVEDTHLCAGSYNDNRDSCKGDSGGPIFTHRGDASCIYTILGVTSFGPEKCGTKGVPGVYTRVYTYLDWIERNVWPNE